MGRAWKDERRVGGEDLLHNCVKGGKREMKYISYLMEKELEINIWRGGGCCGGRVIGEGHHLSSHELRSSTYLALQSSAFLHHVLIYVCIIWLAEGYVCMLCSLN